MRSHTRERTERKSVLAVYAPEPWGFPEMREDLVSLSLAERVGRYRVRAEKAIQTAYLATDPIARVQFFRVAQGWYELADLIERTRESEVIDRAFLDHLRSVLPRKTSSGPDGKPGPSCTPIASASYACKPPASQATRR
jgi:hypothetical protein